MPGRVVRPADQAGRMLSSGTEAGRYIVWFGRLTKPARFFRPARGPDATFVVWFGRPTKPAGCFRPARGPDATFVVWFGRLTKPARCRYRSQGWRNEMLATERMLVRALTRPFETRLAARGAWRLGGSLALPIEANTNRR